MSDARLRALELQWASSGAVEDEAALIGAKLRAQLLDPARIEILALAGHPASLGFLGVSQVSGQDLATRLGVSMEVLLAWKHAGAPLSREACELGAVLAWHEEREDAQPDSTLELRIRAIHFLNPVAAYRGVHGVVSSDLKSMLATFQTLRRVMWRTETWLANPSPAGVEAAVDASTTLHEDLNRDYASPRAYAAVQAVYQIARATKGEIKSLVRALSHCVEFFYLEGPLTRGEAEVAVLKAIQNALVPWALASEGGGTRNSASQTLKADEGIG